MSVTRAQLTRPSLPASSLEVMRSWRGPERVVVTALALGAWTLFVWVGRLRNLAAEPGSIFDASRWSLVGSVAFTVLGLAVAAWALALWSGRANRVLAPAVGALAALTIGVWLLRAVDIAAGDHSVGFIVVHLVLAVVSIGLALAAVAGLRRRSDRSADDTTDDAETTDGRLPSKRWVSL